jgi:hypothetical protein
MGLQVWWVAQRSDATLEALVIWWSVGGGLRKFTITHTQPIGILFGKWPIKVAWSETRGHFWGFCSHFCELSIKR